MVCVETVENWTNLAVIICQLLSADDAMEIGLHKLLDDCIGRGDEQIERAANKAMEERKQTYSRSL